MGRYRKKRKIMALDLTPLIDVVFLLLIFFMVSTTFNKYGKIDIELPSSTVVNQTKDSKIEIVIDKNEKYFAIVDGKTSEIDINNLGELLAGLKRCQLQEIKI